MADTLNPQILRNIAIEIIFMTYGTVTRTINDDAFPNAVPLYNPEIMSYTADGTAADINLKSNSRRRNF